MPSARDSSKPAEAAARALDPALPPTEQWLTVSPGPTPRRVRVQGSPWLTVPEDWALLEPGDAALTRRVRAAGPCWVVEVPWKNRTRSLGTWAPADVIERERAARGAEQADPTHQRRLAQSRARAEKKQADYEETFQQAILRWLAFAPRWQSEAETLAARVTAHATPVGSGTVARTTRIPVEERARAAVMAWMRHQCSDYDDRHIPRVRGLRGQVRRDIAADHRDLLEAFRRGVEREAGTCPLLRALQAPVGDS